MFKIVSLVVCVVVWLMAAIASAAAAPAATFSLDARAVLHGYRAATEEHLEGVLSGLRALAATEEARSGDWEQIKGPLFVFARGVPTEAAVLFVRPDGAYYSVEKGFTDQNVSDRGYFPGLIAGHEVPAALVVSKSTGKKAVVVAAPIVREGRVTGALGVSVSVESLAAHLDDQLKLPSGVGFYALDPEGRTALHREGALMFEFPSQMGDPSLSRAVKTMLSRPEGSVVYTFRGQRKVAVFERSASTGWVFVLTRASPIR